MKKAKDEEADSLSTPCSLCHMSLDIYQGLAGQAGKYESETSRPAPATVARPRHGDTGYGPDVFASPGQVNSTVRTVEIRRTAQNPVYATCILSSQDTSTKAMYTETRTRSTWYWKVKCTFQVWPEKQVLDPWEAMSLTDEEYGVKKHTVQRLKVFLFVMPNPA